ncbi:uncharacterized protein LOC131661225 [Vicia villosa]|uniref:uncharacterized protein LOC131661225 n=1 Tax=Vicia villosa TaxID=3911 RepID=UPI00273ABEFB|nr:uncharacterized protein LOC131661225 [Vicia villosa]
MNERRGKQQQNHGKPYSALTDKGKQKAINGKRTSGRDAPTGVVCFKCDRPGHKSNVCTREVKRCFRCRNTGHEIADCKYKAVVYFNYGEERHISTQCQKPKKEPTGGKVFGLAETQTSSEDRLSRANGLMTTSLVCLKCALSIFDKDFTVDLICLPLSGLDSVRFSNPDNVKETEFLSSRQLNELTKDGSQVFALVASLSIENQAMIDELQVVQEFAKVFPDDIPDVPPEREVEFATDLVPGTRTVSKAPYRMSTSELTELKKQLEKLLENKFANYFVFDEFSDKVVSDINMFHSAMLNWIFGDVDSTEIVTI